MLTDNKILLVLEINHFLAVNKSETIVWLFEKLMRNHSSTSEVDESLSLKATAHCC